MKIFSNILFVTFLLSSICFANEFPKIKSGYWETTTDDGMKIKQCVDSESLKDLFAKANKRMKGTCDEIKITKKGDKFVSNATCKIMGSVMTVKSEVSGDFDKEYISKSTTKFEPPFMGQSGDTTTQTSKLISSKCPEGMVAGDIITNDGTKMNTNKVLENMPDMNQVNKMMEGLQNGKGMDPAQMQKMLEQMQKNMGQ